MATPDSVHPCSLGDVIEGENLGQVVKVSEKVPAYVSAPKDSNGVGVFIFTDVFGWELPNTRRVSDFLAKQGFTVIVPDVFDGDIWLEGKLDFSKFPEWRAKHLWHTKASIVKDSVKFLQENYGLKKFAAMGFCWGGGAVQGFLSNHDLFQAGVAFYGLIDQVPEVKNVFQPQGPLLFLFGGSDTAIPQERVDQLEANLKANSTGVPFKVKVFPGQPHGFAHRKKAASRGDDDDKAQEEALSDAINWLKQIV